MMLWSDVAERAFLAQHLAHPQRRPPRESLDDVVNAADECGEHRARLRSRREQALAQHTDDGRHALGDERVEQLFFAAEVVIDESGGDAGLQRDTAQARGGDAVGRETRDRRVEEPLALVRFFGARPAGAARLALLAGGSSAWR